jgi:hypothetical protein
MSVALQGAATGLESSRREIPLSGGGRIGLVQ